MLALAAASLGGPLPTSARVEESAPPPASPGFYPSQYIGKETLYNCADLDGQDDAQAVLRADPSDPDGLDADNDGMACERNRVARDLDPVARA